MTLVPVSSSCIFLSCFLGVGCPRRGLYQRTPILTHSNKTLFWRSMMLTCQDRSWYRNLIVSVLAKRETENLSPSHFDLQQTPQRKTTTTKWWSKPMFTESTKMTPKREWTFMNHANRVQELKKSRDAMLRMLPYKLNSMARRTSLHKC